jgi:hypothetical protein
LRAMQTHRQSRASDSLPDRRRAAASARAQDIACKTLPYVFARKGLLPLHDELDELVRLKAAATPVAPPAPLIADARIKQLLQVGEAIEKDAGRGMLRR